MKKESSLLQVGMPFNKVMPRLRKILLFAGLMALSVSSCQAGLGDTMDECIAQYGQQTQGAVSEPNYQKIEAGSGNPYSGLVFTKDGFKIQVLFLNEKAGEIIYSKSDNSGMLPSSDVKAFLAANAGGQKWTQTTVGAWARTDGATASSIPGYLTLMTKEFAVDKASKKSAPASGA